MKEIKSVDEVKTALDKITDKVNEAGEKALSEAKKAGEMSASTREKVDELLVEQGKLLQENADIKARLAEVEQKGARLDTRGSNENLSLGERFVKQEGFAKFAEEKGHKKMSMNVKAVTSITSATTGTGAAGDLVRADRVINPMMGLPERRFRIRDLIAAGRTGSNTIEFTKETGFQNMAAVVAEGAAKPQSDIAYDLVTQSVATIAHWIDASKQILADAPMLASYIDTRLTYGLKDKEDLQLLLGDGLSGNLNGIYTQATAYSAPAGGVVGTATIIDTIRLAILQAALAQYPVDGIVLNPIQWAAIETLKDEVGRYIIGNPQGTAMPMLWGRPVAETTAMTTDKFLVGAFGMGAQVFDREDANITVSTETGDNFKKNMVTILAEERLALAVYRPEAFIKGDLGLVS